MRIGLLIPDGVGIRNYLYSDVLKYLKSEGHEIVIWHDLPEEVVSIAEELHDLELEQLSFKSYADPFLIRLLREATSYARLRINARNKNNSTILSNWNNKRNTLGKKVLYPMAEMLGATLSSYNAVERVEAYMFKLYEKTPAYKEYSEVLNKLKVDVLFCTHQRAPHVVAAMLAAKKAGVSTKTAIFSWDNLPKARLPFRAHQYLVWSDYMQEELISYYTDIEESSIEISGTPQFDFYRKEENLVSRKDFAEKYNLDPGKKWILFSGDDVITSPYDSDYLRDVAEAVQSIDNVQVLFRQVPVEGIERYEEHINNFPNVVHIPPQWTKGAKWNNSFPLKSDVALLVNLAKHCAAVVNVGSTMALDFSNFNVPGLYINYDQPQSENWTVEVIYSFQHFKTMDGLDAVGWINSKSEIKDKLLLALNKPEEVGPDRKKWFERIVQPDQEKSASQRIAEVLTTI